MNSIFLSIIVFFVIQINFCLCQDFTTYLPNYNQIIVDQNPEFRWNNIENCSNYIIEISNSANFSNFIVIENTLTNSFIPSVSLGYNDWYWRVKAVIGGDTLLSNTSKFCVFKPNELSENILWLDASQGVEIDGNGMVSTWNDLSPNGYSFVQILPTNRPILGNTGPNNTESLQFSGNQFLDGGDILDLGTSSRTFFVVGSSQLSASTTYGSCFIAKSAYCYCSNRFAFLYYNNSTYFLYHETAQYEIASIDQQLGLNSFKITTDHSRIHKND